LEKVEKVGEGREGWRRLERVGESVDKYGKVRTSMAKYKKVVLVLVLVLCGSI
jgi:hypothetical protein